MIDTIDYFIFKKNLSKNQKYFGSVMLILIKGGFLSDESNVNNSSQLNKINNNKTRKTITVITI